eukprot:g685.t1
MHPHPKPGNRHRKSVRKLKAVGRKVREKGWVERRTLDGVPYFYHQTDESLTWEKPDALKTPAEKSENKSDWYHWVADRDEGWVAKKGKGSWQFRKTELGRLEDDIVMLDHINEAQISYVIRKRYEEDKIYTWCGASKTVLVSINPFKWDLPLYTPSVIEKHRKPPANRPLEPHVYDIANHALKSMMLEGKNQSILISGESGAGKTEAAKQCFNFLAETAGSESNVEQLILSANPLLEAFGNAKTLRNNNSSRFGKWVAIGFDWNGKIVKAKADSFLLEKSRVVTPARGERNFHIFYQLFSSSRHREKYKLTSPEKYRYLGVSGCYVADGIDDAKEFEDTQQSMKQLGFKKSMQSWMFSTVAALLHLGSISFKPMRVDSADGCAVKSRKRLQRAAEFLGVPIDDLEKAVTYRSIKVGRKSIAVPLKPQEAVDACDALSKSIYDRLFRWIVERVNAATGGESKSKKNEGKFIGVLDIFGFEIMKRNSFEQICINYCNEKLQQFFNKHTFKQEESVYISEGVPYTKIEFIDNQPVLDMIEKKRKGLLPLLDDEVRLPKGSDKSYMQKVDKTHKTTKAYIVPRPRRNALLFTISHYAGDVDYDGRGWLDKNKDPLYDDLSALMSESNAKYMKQLFKDVERSGSRKATVSERFRKQLRSLMTMLDKTEPSYIRCIKPNHEKKPNMFMPIMSMDQMRNAGVFEAVAIRKSGYPFRKTHEEFAEHFACVDPSAKKGPPRKMAIRLLRTMSKRANLEDVQLGETMVLYRAKEHRLMELMRALALGKAITGFQALARGVIARKYAKRVRKVDRRFRKVFASDDCDIEMLDDALSMAAEVIGTLSNIFSFEPRCIHEARQRRVALQAWADIEASLKELEKVPTEQCYDRLFRVVEKADALKKKGLPMTKRQQSLRKKAKKRLRDCASARIDPEAEEATYLLDKPRMEAVLKEAAEMRYRSEHVEEIERLLALEEAAFVKLQLKKAIELRDPIRRINREIWLRMNGLKNSLGFIRFTKYPKLKHPAEFANASWSPFGRDKLEEGMLCHTTSTLHTSLLRDLSSTATKQAKTCFKNILCYMGDRKFNGNADMLAAEMLSIGMNALQDDLRAEIYLQLFKQLTNNPSPQSEKRGWALLALCCKYLSPPEEFEDYLLTFLMQRKPNGQSQKYISTFHELKYRSAGEAYQPPPRPPTATEIASEMGKLERRDYRSRYSMREIVQQHKIERHSRRTKKSNGASRARHDDDDDDDDDDDTSAPPPPRRDDAPVEPWKEPEEEEDDEDEDAQENFAASKTTLTGDEETRVAGYDFTPMDDTMIALTEGDTVALLSNPEDDGWVYVRNQSTGETGYVPTDYLE